MDQDNSLAAGRDARILARKSWTAYIRVVLVGIVGLLLVVPAACNASWVAGLIALLLVGGFLTYQIMDIRSHQLYVDDVGVWHARGILPWNKGVAGVKWRDLDEAVFFQGVSSWLLKSYTVRIGHRFTKANEIVMTHMAGGHEAVMAVNSMHQDMVRQGRLS
jgi:hypothetical protein